MIPTHSQLILRLMALESLIKGIDSLRFPPSPMGPSFPLKVDHLGQYPPLPLSVSSLHHLGSSPNPEKPKVMEWVDGVKLTDANGIRNLGRFFFVYFFNISQAISWLGCVLFFSLVGLVRESFPLTVISIWFQTLSMATFIFIHIHITYIYIYVYICVYIYIWIFAMLVLAISLEYFASVFSKIFAPFGDLWPKDCSTDGLLFAGARWGCICNG